jgi:hypothetical protein
VCDEEITEKEWKECARESLMHEDGWGDEESEGEVEVEDLEEALDLGDGLVIGATHPCLDAGCFCSQLPVSCSFAGIKDISLSVPIPIKVPSVLPSQDLEIEEETWLKRVRTTSAFVMEFWEFLMKTSWVRIN